MEKYIHYGHKNFDVNLFCPIKNRDFFVKPDGGLWASNINAEYSWKDWCESTEFKSCNEDNSFTFFLSEDAKILKIKSSDQLKLLPKLDGETETGCVVSWVLLDFEELSREYDAIEVYISYDKNLYFDLYGWDCDSILIMNPGVINMIE